VRADTVLLVVEVSASSLAVDLGIKAARCAAAGVREYWGHRRPNFVTTLHREPSPEGTYAHCKQHPATDRRCRRWLPRGPCSPPGSASTGRTKSLACNREIASARSGVIVLDAGKNRG
jgi:hypothetical protein